MDGVISLPSATHKPTKRDILPFFRGRGSDTRTSSPINAFFLESVASPPLRSKTLSSDAALSPSQDTAGLSELSSTHKPVTQPLPSALATARHIRDVYQIPYPEGIRSPKPELNTNVKDGKFRYDRDFLLQFMSVCKEKPDNLPNLEAIGLEPVDQSHSMGRGGSGRRGVSGSMGPPTSTTRQGSVGLGLGPLNGKVGSNFAMGQFSAGPKLTSEERFMRSTSLSGGPGAMPFVGGRASPMVRSSSQGGPGAMGNKRTRSKRGDATRNESNRINAAVTQFNMNTGAPFEPVAPLEHSANRWVPGSTSRRGAQVDQHSPEIEDKKARTLVNNLNMKDFDFTSNQIIVWVNKSENERDRRSLIQVIRLVFEKAVNEAAWSGMYARLCQKMMEQMNPGIHDDGFCDAEDESISSDFLFREYLLNRCHEDFERTWSAREMMAVTAKERQSRKEAVNDSTEDVDVEGDVYLYWDEDNAALEAKRQALHLIKFMGELFELEMLTDHIMHECIKKLLSNVDDPDEEEIECLCALLTNIGQALDTPKARGHMAIYFARMKVLSRSSKVQPHAQAVLQDVIELRERKWTLRSAGTVCPLQGHNGLMDRASSSLPLDSLEIVDKKVRALLNVLTTERFDSISNRIIGWVNKGKNEKDGRALSRVTRLVFEKAIDEADSNEIYARLCRKMMKQISSNVQDDGIRNTEDKPITGGLLFRKYLLNRCQEDFERGWSAKETTAAAAKVKETEDQAVKNANEKNKGEDGEISLYSEEYYAAQKAKRQGLGLIKFIGELYKLQMLTERIMHECIKKLLSNVDNPEEEEIESLCKLLTTVGQALDTSKARGHMDVYFARMKELVRSSNVSSRMQFMLQDVIELRERKWIPRNAAAAPQTIAQIHETEKAQQEQHNLTHNASGESTPWQRLNLLPRSKPLPEASQPSPAESHADEDGEEGEIIEKDSGKPSMSKEQAEKKIDQDRKEFFAIRDLDEGEEYFSAYISSLACV
ncbi:hypothetical protein ACEPAF_5589 [Sanghuangporus sanghuang]